MHLSDRFNTTLATSNRAPTRLCGGFGKLDQAVLRAFLRRRLDTLVGEDLLFAGEQGRRREGMGRVLLVAKQERLDGERHPNGEDAQVLRLTSSLIMTKKK
jgi:hypothetical protein